MMCERVRVCDHQTELFNMISRLVSQARARVYIDMFMWMKLTSKSPMVNRVAASESTGGRSGLIIYVYTQTHIYKWFRIVLACNQTQKCNFSIENKMSWHKNFVVESFFRLFFALQNKLLCPIIIIFCVLIFFLFKILVLSIQINGQRV